MATLEELGPTGSHECSVCPAAIHGHSYTDVNEDSSWVTRLYSEGAFKLKFPNRCAILDVSGVSHMALASDNMHNKYLGMDMYYAASMLYLLVYVMLDGTCRKLSVKFTQKFM